MKKLLLILLAVCIVLPASGFAQMGFGFLAGINLANATGDDADMGMGIDPKMKLGLVGGAFAQMPLSDNLAFRVEALYSQKGAKYEAMGVTVKANIVQLIEVSPKKIELSLRKNGCIPDIQLASRDGKPFSIKAFQSTNQ